MDIFARFFDYITDGTKKISYKAATITSFIVLIFLLDNTLGFSYYYNAEKQINIIEKFKVVFADSTLSEVDKIKLKALRNHIIYHKSIKDYSWDFFTSANFFSNYSGTNSIIHYLTSSYLIIICMIVVLYIGLKAFIQSFSLVNKILKNDSTEILIKLIGVEGILYIITIIEAKALSYMPLIFGKTYYNYIFNIIASTLLFLIVAYIYSATGTKKKQTEKGT